MDPIFLAWLVSVAFATTASEEEKRAFARRLRVDRPVRRGINDAFPALETAQRKEIEAVLRAAGIQFDPASRLPKLRETLVTALAYRSLSTDGMLGGRLSDEQVNDLLRPSTLARY